MKRLSTRSSSKKEILTKTIETLKSGGLVIFPSDTVYGLLVDAANQKAVEKLIEFKSRPKGKAISVFVDWSLLDKTVSVDKNMLQRVKDLFPGPFTIILPSKDAVNKLLESEDRNLGVRIPDFQLINDLVAEFKKPITATSANLSGRSPHHSVKALLNSLSGKKKALIDLIVDAGTLPRRKPSTVVDMTKPKIKILRKGDMELKNKSVHVSNSEKETKKIAQDLLKQILSKKDSKPKALIIKGTLGAGKTVFVKGIGEHLGITNIISPTYVIEYEYKVNKFGLKSLIHFDLYTISDPEEFKYLGIEKYLRSSNLLCFEWGERAGEVLPLLQDKSRIVMITAEHVDEKSRKFTIEL